MAKLIEKLLSLDGHVCPWWMAWTFDNPLRKLFQDPERILGSLVREGMIVADIGCGMGYFSVAMARMVGPAGRVLSVDLQEKMLQYLEKRAEGAGVQDRISAILAEPDDIKITDSQVDFMLAFWMVHEVKDIPRFFGQVAKALKPSGSMLCVEPRMHVSPRRFGEILGYGKSAGFVVSDGPKVGMSRSAVLARAYA
jgi:ubiquinone/menaquinone biosynthesis C-methylase UbiE